MKKLWLSLALLPVPAFAQSAENCEVVTFEKLKGENADVAAFRPADDYINSVYNDDANVLRTIDGLPIRGLLCERGDVIPTLRDYPLVATGIPLSISENFDATNSRTVTIIEKSGVFKHIYKGTPLSPADEDKLSNVMEVFNLQPRAPKEK